MKGSEQKKETDGERSEIHKRRKKWNAGRKKRSWRAKSAIVPELVAVEQR